MIRRAGLVAGWIVLLVAAGTVTADDTHYRGIPIGAHAIGLGGAFTAVADDASAVYFNPAGLTLGGNFGLSAGLSVNAWERFDLQRAFDQPAGIETATVKTTRNVPIFVGAGFKFGPKDAYGNRKYALGLSVVEPIFFSGGLFLVTNLPELGLADTYDVRFTDRDTWYGVSFAGRIGKNHSLGVALHLSHRRLEHSETGLGLTGGAEDPDDPGTFLGTSSAANTQFLNVNAYHFVFRLGWLYRARPQLKFGVMLQPPGIPIRQTASTLSQGFVNDNRDPTTGSRTAAYFLQGSVDANLPIPLELEAGLQYWPAENIMLALDASFHGPVRSSDRVQLAPSAPDEALVGGLFFDNDTLRLPTGNVAVAGEFGIRRRVTIQAGFFTDLSSAQRIPENPDRYYNYRINRYAGTLSVGVDVSGISLAIGSTFVYGRGDATGIVIDVDELVLDYTRTQATSRIVYVHLTGVTRAAEQIGGRLERKMKKKRKNEVAPEPDAQ